MSTWRPVDATDDLFLTSVLIPSSAGYGVVYGTATLADSCLASEIRLPYLETAVK